MTYTHKKRLYEKTLSLNVFLLTLIVLSVAAVNSSLPIIKNLFKSIKAIISFKVNINIFLYVMLLGLLILGGFSIYLYIILGKYSLGGPLFTLFIRFSIISDDG